MHKRTKACSISEQTKRTVWERDNGKCIFCGSRAARPEAHVISRAHGGLGIARNIVTVCRSCHDKMDNSTHRKEMVEFAKNYLKSYYPEWTEESVTYHKGSTNE